MAHRDPEFAFLAHDLCQLLWAIQGRARALAGRLGPDAARAAESIAEDAAAAAAMLTASEAPRAEPVPVILAAWRQALDHASTRGLPIDRFGLRAPAEAPAVAMPAAALRRILGNLFANAVAAMPAGGEVVCAIDGTPHEIRLRIEDQGPGVPASLGARLFEIGATTDREGGHGLGLAGARALARQSGGDLVWDATTTGGRFVLTVPAAGAGAPAVAGSARGAEATALRILAVDDEPAVLGMLEELLAVEGHRVTVAADHDSALAGFAAARYDAALIDLSLPGGTGPALAAALRRADPPLAIVVLTGWGRESELEALDRTCVDSTGIKPLDLPLLRRLLADAAALTARRRGDRSGEG
ncbi:MAG TPA: response regulator [Candidatus Krumholzibacteria bacterium]|nr:response regulator [Candidatus Krumholzibacteria bacterium]HPD72180.1 response regulator [Candidatus Krumholzibacteria bacterium]HRY40888.1 response regulator [Candidatus Krumholzibacteria bacterium]